MRESTTYQAVLEEGRREGLEQGAEGEARELLVRIGTKRFGAPSKNVREALSAIEDKDRLERLVVRALDVETWNELLDPNGMLRKRRCHRVHEEAWERVLHGAGKSAQDAGKHPLASAR